MRPEKEILKEIGDVYCSLSPENLYCDGEISKSEANRKFKILNRKLRVLFVELGREVSEEEAWGIR